MSKWAGFDIEIAKEMPDKADWRPFRPLGITCGSLVADDFVENFFGGQYNMSFHEQMSKDECNRMLDRMLARQKEGYNIVTWNGLSFDFDVLAEETGRFSDCAELALHHYDPMFQVLCIKGFPIGLDPCAKGMGLPGKIEGMHGDMASVMWKQGKYKEVLEYVQQDSQTTLDVINDIDEIEKLYWITGAGQRKNIWPFIPLPVITCLSLPLPDTSWMRPDPARPRMTCESCYKWIVDGGIKVGA